MTIEQTVTISALSHDGRGIAKIDGKTVFIAGALPGEEVLFTYSKKRNRFDEGYISDPEQIIHAAPERVEPKCAHFSICGGCKMQHYAAKAQILSKQAVLLEQLEHFGRISPELLLPPLDGPTWGYRHKARLGVRYVRKKNKVLVGFREKQNSSYIAEINKCVVLHPNIGLLIEPLKQLITDLECYQSIPQIEVAVADNATALVIRHLDAITESDRSKLCAFAENHKLLIYLQPKGIDSIHLLQEKDQSTSLYYNITDHDLKITFQPTDFTQINFQINQKMINRVLELLELTAEDNVLDLFCGLGNLSLPTAKYCNSVVGIEGDAQMVQRAAENAKANNINNTSFYAADLTTNIMHNSWAKEKYSKIIIDPPRTGALEIIHQLANIAAQRIVYVSCNPATLARDAGELVKQGYRLSKAGIMDMFPHTAHTEAIALFERS